MAENDLSSVIRRMNIPNLRVSSTIMSENKLRRMKDSDVEKLKN